MFNLCTKFVHTAYLSRSRTRIWVLRMLQSGTLSPPSDLGSKTGSAGIHISLQLFHPHQSHSGSAGAYTSYLCAKGRLHPKQVSVNSRVTYIQSNDSKSSHSLLGQSQMINSPCILDWGGRRTQKKPTWGWVEQATIVTIKPRCCWCSFKFKNDSALCR